MATRPVFRIKPKGIPAPTRGAEQFLPPVPDMVAPGIPTAQGFLNGVMPQAAPPEAYSPELLQTFAKMALEAGAGQEQQPYPTAAQAQPAAGPRIPGYNFDYVDYPTPPEPIALPVRDEESERKQRNLALQIAAFAPLLGQLGGSGQFGATLFNQLAQGGLQGAQAGAEADYQEDLQQYQLASNQQGQDYARRRQIATDTNAGIDRQNALVEKREDNERLAAKDRFDADLKNRREIRYNRQGDAKLAQQEAATDARLVTAALARGALLTPDMEASLVEYLNRSVGLGIKGNDLFKDMTPRERMALEETARRNGIYERLGLDRIDLGYANIEGQNYRAQLGAETSRFGITTRAATAANAQALQAEIADARIAADAWKTDRNINARDALLRTRLTLKEGSPQQAYINKLQARYDANDRFLASLNDDLTKLETDPKFKSDVDIRIKARQIGYERDQGLKKREEIKNEIADAKKRIVDTGEGLESITITERGSTSSTSAPGTPRPAGVRPRSQLPLPPPPNFQGPVVPQGRPARATAPVTTRATTFGYNDPIDNGRGAFGANTNNTKLAGVALPMSTLRATFGNNRNAWKNAKVEVTNPATGVTAVLPVVDIGPAERLKAKGTGIDLTYAAANQLGIAYPGTGNVTFRILGADGNAEVTEQTKRKAPQVARPTAATNAAPAPAAPGNVASSRWRPQLSRLREIGFPQKAVATFDRAMAKVYAAKRLTAEEKRVYESAWALLRQAPRSGAAGASIALGSGATSRGGKYEIVGGQ